MTMYTGAEGGPVSTSRRQSFIDKDTHFSGTHSTPNDFLVEGHFDGTIECAGSLIVADTADVNARVTAGSVAVAGHLQGEIGCRGKFEILPSGRVEARVRAASIVVHEGALYDGEMSMRGEAGSETSSDQAIQRRPEPRPQRRTPAAESTEVPSFSASGGRANGRPLPDDNAPRPPNDRGTQSGQTIGSED